MSKKKKEVKPNEVYTDLETKPKCKSKECNEDIYKGSRCFDCYLERGGYQNYKF